MTDDNFAIADQVVLRSGGPVMTVDEVHEGEVSVCWMLEGRLERATFKAALLRKWTTAMRGPILL